MATESVLGLEYADGENAHSLSASPLLPPRVCHDSEGMSSGWPPPLAPDGVNKAGRQQHDAVEAATKAIETLHDSELDGRKLVVRFDSKGGEA